MNPSRWSVVYLLIFGLMFAGSTFAQQPSSVTSPDGRIQLSFSVAKIGDASTGELTYAISFQGKPVIVSSPLGLQLEKERALGAIVRSVNGGNVSKIDESYTVPAGKANPIRNLCNALSLKVDDLAGSFTVEARAYNDGIAFRYVLPAPQNELRIENERTRFRLAKDGMTYPLVLRNYRTSWEDNYRAVPLSGISPESLIALPFLAEVPGAAWMAITEANLDNYPGMYLRRGGKDDFTLSARLSPRVDDPNYSVYVRGALQTPWRIVMIADDPGRLIESNIVTNLNPPSAIADTSWIKPGKAAWDWWSGSTADNVNFTPGMNTATMKHYIDFASRAKLEYMMVDAGWAKKGNPAGPYDSGSILSETNPDVNVSDIISYAKSKNVGVWLWAHWLDVDRQMNEVFPLFETWGVAGVKIDFMDRDDQEMVNFYRRVAAKAAQHHLMLDFHGAFKPDGLRRTYPNVMTREGVMGLEYNKWSGRITPDHNVMLPFTRMLAGPMDYTPGGMRNATKEQFEPRGLKPMIMGTRAHQTALFVVYESPFMMVSDYPEAYAGQKELAFISAVPTTWDETRVLNARVGDYITIARRRGKEWYVGSIAGSQGAELSIPLSFLGSGNWTAEIYSDAPDAAQNPTKTVFEKQKVNSATVLKARLVSGGGHAVRIVSGE
jgi:alpha-glucosidase